MMLFVGVHFAKAVADARAVVVHAEPHGNLAVK